MCLLVVSIYGVVSLKIQVGSVFQCVVLLSAWVLDGEAGCVVA